MGSHSLLQGIFPTLGSNPSPALTTRTPLEALASSIGRDFTDAGSSLVAQLVKNPPAVRETWVRPLHREDPPGEGKGYLLQYSGLENSMDCIVHRVAKSRTRLSDFHFQDLLRAFHYIRTSAWF